MDPTPRLRRKMTGSHDRLDLDPIFKILDLHLRKLSCFSYLEKKKNNSYVQPRFESITWTTQDPDSRKSPGSATQKLFMGIKIDEFDWVGENFSFHLSHPNTERPTDKRNQNQNISTLTVFGGGAGGGKLSHAI